MPKERTAPEGLSEEMEKEAATMMRKSTLTPRSPVKGPVKGTFNRSIPPAPKKPRATIPHNNNEDGEEEEPPNTPTRPSPSPQAQSLLTPQIRTRTQSSVEEIIRETPPADIENSDQDGPYQNGDATPAAILKLTKEALEIMKKQKTTGEPAKAKQAALAKLEDAVARLERHDIEYDQQVEAARAAPVDTPLFYGPAVEIMKAMYEEVLSSRKEIAEVKKELSEVRKEMSEARREMSQIKDIMQKNATENSKSWAQRVGSAPPTAEHQNAERQRKQFRAISPEKEEELKEKRHKTAVTLTMAKVLEVTKAHFRETPAKAVTKSFQQAINAVYNGKTETIPQVCGFNILSGDTIRLQCVDEKSATVLKESMEWNKACAGIELKKRKYGIVVHGISKADLNPSSATRDEINELEEDNKRTNLHIAEILPLRRRAKRHEAALHQSIIIFTNCPHEADDCINQGVIVKGQHYDAEKYTPQLNITQCFRCYGYGHRAPECTTIHLQCGKCGKKEHDTKSCPEDSTPRCFHCQGPHPAWHIECRRRDEESQRLLQERSKTSPFYTL